MIPLVPFPEIQSGARKVDVVRRNLIPQQPPDLLYHGTASRNLGSIRRQGLLRGRRHHVHLSLDKATAVKVGQRHGAPVVLTIQAGKMWQAGIPFFCSANGVWLTEQIAPEYIEFPTEDKG